MPLLLGNSQTTGKWGLVLAWKGRRSLNISGQNKSSRNRHKLCFQTLPPKSLQVGKPASINSERAQRGSNGLAGPHLFGSLSSPATPPPQFLFTSFSLYLLRAGTTVAPPPLATVYWTRSGHLV